MTDTPAYDEAIRRGWRVQHKTVDTVGGHLTWLVVIDNEGRKITDGESVNLDVAGIQMSDGSTFTPGMDWDVEAERLCAKAIQSEQARVDRWHSRSRLSRAWAALTGAPLAFLLTELQSEGIAGNKSLDACRVQVLSICKNGLEVILV